VSGVFFEILIETKDGNAEEAFGHLEHTGKNGRRYVHYRPMKSWHLHVMVSIPLGILRFFGAALAPIVQNASHTAAVRYERAYRPRLGPRLTWRHQ